MQTCWEVIGVDLSNWAPWCRLFHSSDDKAFIVDADLAPPPGWITHIVRRNTAVFYCEKDGGVTDLVPDFQFPSGTPVERAVILMGYALEAPREYERPEGEPEPVGSFDLDAFIADVIASPPGPATDDPPQQEEQL